MIECLKEYLKANDVEYKEKQSLSVYSPIKIGGEADIVVFPNSEEKLVFVILFCKSKGIKYRIVGNMSNLLPLDCGFGGAIIKTDRLNGFSVNENRVIAYAGVKLPVLSASLADAGLSGFEGLSGIPGQLGGSIFGNAGAFGCEIGELVVSCRLYSPVDDKIIALRREDLDFSYRKSRLSSEELVLLSAEFKLVKADRENIYTEMMRCRDVRKRTQPTAKPSLGSFFKHTATGEAAARLIDRCGLKGMRVGDAAVSEKHAGFIINLDSASATDVLSLASYIEERVYNSFSVRLVREVELLI